jgi:hypothetical protein
LGFHQHPLGMPTRRAGRHRAFVFRPDNRGGMTEDGHIGHLHDERADDQRSSISFGPHGTTVSFISSYSRLGMSPRSLSRAERHATSRRLQ